MITVYSFSVVPLVYLDQGWSLWHLGLTYALGYMGRGVLLQGAINMWGAWMAVPILMSGAVLTVVMCTWPEAEWAVTGGVFATTSCVPELAVDILNFKRFQAGSSLPRAQRAMNMG